MKREIEELLANIDAHHERVWQIQRSVERMEITGYAGNGDVTVKLRGTGELSHVDIDERLLRAGDAEAVGYLVVEAVNDGLRRLGEASRRTFEPLIAEAEATF